MMTAMTQADAAREEFELLAGQYRAELLGYCYRMLGSIHDAEDALQEALVRAWRGYGTFEGRSSARTWLYRIAANACLRLLEQRDRRPLPSGLGGPSGNPDAPVSAAPADVAWLEPFPDVLLSSATADPAAVVAARSGLRLAVVAALQQLPARQRTVFILRDVLGWRSAEVAELLDASVIAVNSALQRAREQVRGLSVRPEEAREPAAQADQALVDRYARAIEEGDVAALVGLLAEDATFEMPPMPAWFRGSSAIGRFFGTHILTAPGKFTLVKTAANGQPAFAFYSREQDGTRRAHGIQVLTIEDRRITGITAFLDRALFPLFGLPLTVPANGPLD
jgi:RNA polymerase sigma-70 factor (ECF subfamily)